MSSTLNNTIVVFDWDDTLFPTSALLRKCEGPNIALHDLNNIFTSTYNTLASYISIYGADNVYIVTNGTQSWILDSMITLRTKYSQTELPGLYVLYNLLSDSILDIKKISARYLYQAQYPGNTAMWKFETMKNLFIDRFNKDTFADPTKQWTVISIGDSTDEFKASLMAVKYCKMDLNKSDILLHRVKLLSKPTISDLFNQNLLLANKLAKKFAQLKQSVTVDYGLIRTQMLMTKN